MLVILGGLAVVAWYLFTSPRDTEAPPPSTSDVSTPEPITPQVKPVNWRDPVQVADAFIKELTAQGVVKQSKFLGAVPGPANGMVTVDYQLDYITKSGLRREGGYELQVVKSKDGTYQVINEYSF